MIEIPTDLPEAMRWVLALPPENVRQLTFHLPLELQALEVAGADERVLRERIERRLPDARAVGLADPPLYRWAEAAYRPLAVDLLDEDVTVRALAFERVAPLGAGLAGAAFHGLIRLGYGSLRRDVDEVARGLAYLRTRPQVLFMPDAATHEAEPLLPDATALRGATIFEALDLVSGSPGVLSRARVDEPVPPVAALCQEALRLLARNPSSFLGVHTVTGLHALAEFELLVTANVPGPVRNDGPLAGWWRAYAWALDACATLVGGMPEETGDRAPEVFSGFSALTRAAIASCEAHDVKLVVSLGRLVELGVLPLKQAIEAGATKLAATECSI